MNSLASKMACLKMRYTSKYYNIGFAPFIENINSFSAVKDKVSWMRNNNKDRWYADPFILDYSDETVTVFVEEMDYHVRRGILAELIISRSTMEILNRYVILELTTHLSFPAIIRLDDGIYVYPENSRSGNSYIYRYDRERHCLTDKRLLVSAPLTDAAIVNGSFILATDATSPNGNLMTVYVKNDDGFKVSKTVKFESNIARNAGTPFFVGHHLIRTAQDCNGEYGKGVVFQEIKTDGHGDFHFETIGSLYPFDGTYKKGLHTFNVYKELVVIDGYKMPNRYIGGFVNSLFSLALKIKNILRA